MTEIGSGAEAHLLTLQELQQLTATTARYGQAYDPEAVLRSGLVEEVAEFTWEFGTDAPIDKGSLEGELGDILWYVSEISRYRRVEPGAITNGHNLDDFQQCDAPYLIKPIVDYEGNQITFDTHPQGVLAVTALRVVDTLNPKHDDLWIPDCLRLSPDAALHDLLAVAGVIAGRQGISLSAAAMRNVAKLQSRPRNPHVIDKTIEAKLIESGRERLVVNPFIGQLIVKSYIAEASTKAK